MFHDKCIDWIVNIHEEPGLMVIPGITVLEWPIFIIIMKIIRLHITQLYQVLCLERHLVVTKDNAYIMSSKS